MTKRSHDYKNGWENYEAGFNNNGPNTFRRLRRNKIDGVFGGVCSGIGDYREYGYLSQKTFARPISVSTARRAGLTESRHRLRFGRQHLRM